MSDFDLNENTQTDDSNFARKVPCVPEITDHELISKIGSGGYGEVWLAKSVLGTHRAVKIVYRSNFQSEEPYKREFNGIKKYEPISRNHDSLVPILQVGRNEESGYFYYIMELADDANLKGLQIKLTPRAKTNKPKSSLGILVGKISRSFNRKKPSSTLSREARTEIANPESYYPKTLSFLISAKKRLNFSDSVKISVCLANALNHLHQNGLVHRDIKPSNIVFVNGIPKLADLGLVADLNEAKSFVGTEGYIPPEGPGTPQADIYSFGKVIYEMFTGFHRNEYPKFPDQSDAKNKHSSKREIKELFEVLKRACAENIKKRYQTVENLRRDLLALSQGYSVISLWRKRRFRQIYSTLFLMGFIGCTLLMVRLYVERTISKDRLQSSFPQLISKDSNSPNLSLVSSTTNSPLNDLLESLANRLPDIGDYTHIYSMRIEMPGKAIALSSVEDLSKYHNGLTWEGYDQIVRTSNLNIQAIEKELRKLLELNPLQKTSFFPANYRSQRVIAQRLASLALYYLHFEKIDLAVNCLIGISYLCHQVEETESLVPHIIRVAIVGLANHTLWDAIQSKKFNLRQLENLHQAWSQVDIVSGSFQSISLEKLEIARLFERIRRSTPSQYVNFLDQFGIQKFPPMGRFPFNVNKSQIKFNLVFPFWQYFLSYPEEYAQLTYWDDVLIHAKIATPNKQKFKYSNSNLFEFKRKNYSFVDEKLNSVVNRLATEAKMKIVFDPVLIPGFPLEEGVVYEPPKLRTQITDATPFEALDAVLNSHGLKRLWDESISQYRITYLKQSNRPKSSLWIKTTQDLWIRDKKKEVIQEAIIFVEASLFDALMILCNVSELNVLVDPFLLEEAVSLNRTQVSAEEVLRDLLDQYRLEMILNRSTGIFRLTTRENAKLIYRLRRIPKPKGQIFDKIDFNEITIQSIIKSLSSLNSIHIIFDKKSLNEILLKTVGKTKFYNISGMEVLHQILEVNGYGLVGDESGKTAEIIHLDNNFVPYYAKHQDWRIARKSIKELKSPEELGEWRDFSLVSSFTLTQGGSKSITTIRKNATQFEMAKTSLALEIFKKKKGRYPNDLIELIGSHFSSLPWDWMDDAPLKYVLKEDGKYLLYSVGDVEEVEGFDDGGDANLAYPRRQKTGFWNGRDAVWPEAVNSQQK